VAIFQFLYQQYTNDFGYGVSAPGIITECNVLSQQIGINTVRGEARGRTDDEKRAMFHARRSKELGRPGRLGAMDHLGGEITTTEEEGDATNDRRLQEDAAVETTPSPIPAPQGYPLTMRFTLRYTTRIGVHDISTYNELFATYVNAHLDKVGADLDRLGLPVASAGDLLMLTDKGPTARPSSAPAPLPTPGPVTEGPTDPPSGSPTTGPPTSVPSDGPSEHEPPPFMDADAITDNSFVLGLSLGLAGAFMISAVALLYHRHAERRRSCASSESAGKNYPGGSTDGGGTHNSQHGNVMMPVYVHGANDSADNLDMSVAASKSTIDLTPNTDASQEHHDDEDHHQPHHSHDRMGVIVDDAHYGTERNDHHHSGMLQPLSSHQANQPHHAMMEQSLPSNHLHHDIEHGEQEPYHSAEPVILQHPFAGGQGRVVDSINIGQHSTHQSTSPEASVNYNNMFALPYQDEYEDTPGALSQQQRGGAAMPNHHEQNQQQQQQQNPQSMMFSTQEGSPTHYPNALMIHNSSFSSSDDSGIDMHTGHGMHALDNLDTMIDPLYNPGLFDGSRDELDNYKNQDLETLRTAIEESVDGVEGMMSLAMTRALTEPDVDAPLEMPWGTGVVDGGGGASQQQQHQQQGNGNDGSNNLEASCLCETYDWLKRNEKSSLDSINEYFQDILNRIVISVMFGMTSPLQGAHLVHACATILGLDLLKELPQTTLVITGMRKTNDLAQGHNFILKAFKPFGKIEEAAIAPNNRGFGFVRFAKPESVKRALKKYREFEIEIQDVSVSIKTLKSERPR